LDQQQSIVSQHSDDQVLHLRAIKSEHCAASDRNTCARSSESANETLFLSMDHARVQIAAWVEDYNHERPHSALGYETPAAFAAELHKQWPAPLRPTGSAPQAIAYPALMRNKTGRL
ncbi:integrase core domain-containing protein, partial [Novosphingobium aerophilum]|uniref:integrase core domain-containing protein n=1 Tax=Novosphingobium aerophilum TaxID=2839843 RepID=UPI001FD24589